MASLRPWRLTAFYPINRNENLMINLLYSKRVEEEIPLHKLRKTEFLSSVEEGVRGARVPVWRDSRPSDSNLCMRGIPVCG